MSNGTVARVDFFAGSTLIDSTSTSPYQIVWNAPPEGTHALTATAIDNLGGTTTSTSVSITVSAAGTGLGTLGAPIASPPSGMYGPGQTVALVAVAGATIRYTTDATAPTVDSIVYSGPITLTGNTTLQAQAFADGWTPSVVTTETYQIDATPPTLVATLSPGPNAAGWNNTPVTATFTCTDDLSGVVVCPQPWLFDMEGAGLTASVTARDVAGNETTTVVSVNIDWSDSVVSLSSPSEGAVFSTSPIAVTGMIQDSLSGVESATCNSERATVSGETVTCSVSLGKGLNVILLQALDRAGNNVSVSVRVTRAGTPSAVMLSPSKSSLLTGTSVRLKAVDDFGRSMTGLTWASNDPAVATVDQAGNVMAVAAGETTITASAGGLSGAATVTVLSVTTFPVGTTRWSADPLPGFQTVGLLSTGPVGSDGTSLLDVEAANDGSGVAIRGLNIAGEQTYLLAAPLSSSEQVYKNMGDVNGGALFSTGPSYAPTAIVRAGPEGGSWRYSDDRLVLNPAQAHDGTIFAIERVVDVQPLIVAIDGLTGRPRFRLPIPQYVYRYQFIGCPQQNYSVLATPDVPGFGYPEQKTPIVIDANGLANVPLLKRDATFVFGGCPPQTGDWSSSSNPQNDWQVLLYRVSTSGAFTSLVVSSEELGEYATLAPQQLRVVPDDQGGVVFHWYGMSGARARYINGTSSMGGDYPTPGRSDLGSPVISGSGRVAYYNHSVEFGVIAADMVTGSILWSRVDTNVGQPTAALTDGQVAISYFPTPTTYLATAMLDANGDLVRSDIPYIVPSVTVDDLWIGLTDTQKPAAVVATSASLDLGAGFPLQEGSGAKSNAPPYAYRDAESAARSALDFIYPYSASANWEWGGLICQQGNRYYWSRVVTSRDQSSVDVLGQTSCLPYGTAVADYHTHPPLAGC